MVSGPCGCCGAWGFRRCCRSITARVNSDACASRRCRASRSFSNSANGTLCCPCCPCGLGANFPCGSRGWPCCGCCCRSGRVDAGCSPVVDGRDDDGEASGRSRPSSRGDAAGVGSGDVIAWSNSCRSVMLLLSVLLPLIVPPAGSVLIGSPSAVSWPHYVTPNVAWTMRKRV